MFDAKMQIWFYHYTALLSLQGRLVICTCTYRIGLISITLNVRIFPVHVLF